MREQLSIPGSAEPQHIRRNNLAALAGDDRMLFFDDEQARELGFDSAAQVRAVRDLRMNMTRLQQASLAQYLRVSVADLYAEKGSE
jgi:hypothetical protein